MTTTTDLTTADAQALEALIDQGQQARAAAEEAAGKARAEAEKKADAALKKAEAARAELARRETAEAERITRRRRAHAYHLIHGGGWDELTAQASQDAAQARRELATALEADPVTVALARAEAASRREAALIRAYTRAAETLGETVPARVTDVRIAGAPDLDRTRAQVADALADKLKQQWAEEHAAKADALIAGDDPALDVHVQTAAERAEANESKRRAELEEFKQRERVESRVSYLPEPSLPYLHRAVVTWHDLYTGESLPEDAPNAPERGTLGIIAEHGRHVPLEDVTSEDVAEAISAGTITAKAAELHGLPEPARR